MKQPRVIKPNPKDPDWEFPYASRAYIESIRKYMDQCGSRHSDFYNKKFRPRSVLPPDRPNKIPWESVPPQYRERCQELFNRKVSIEMAKGIPGWPTPGKIRSIRMNVTNAGRHYFNGENLARYFHYMKYKKMWLLYQRWLVEQERNKLLAERGPAEHKLLEVG